MTREDQPNSGSSSARHKVVVAMSGGVDSSVAAALLVNQGFDVTGIMMRLWSDPEGRVSTLQNRCCTPDQIEAARKVANKLGIRFYVIDVQDYFHKSVVQYFIDGHLQGLTPNPCVACNRHVRFDYLLNHALSLGADYLATGHYARVQYNKGEYSLLKAEDRQKDQSYVLHVLSQAQLKHLMFPIGEFSKSEVRSISEQFSLGVSGKAESMDLCFLTNGDYRSFLERRSPSRSKAGPIMDQEGRSLGIHNGLQNYTIGQRKKLGISSSQPLYVLSKNVDSNQLVVGPREKLARKSLAASGVNWISGRSPKNGAEVEVKIRYKANSSPAVLTNIDSERITVEFREPVYGITPGQAAVIYQEERCLGGGLISDEAAQ